MWVPVDMQLYVQLDAAVGVGVNCLHSTSQRDSLLRLTTSKADALQRLSSLIPYVPFPSDTTRSCRSALATLYGEEMTSAQWSRLTPAMHGFVARVLYLLPCVPWGAKGAGLQATKTTAEARRRWHVEDGRAKEEENEVRRQGLHIAHVLALALASPLTMS